MAPYFLNSAYISRLTKLDNKIYFVTKIQLENIITEPGRTRLRIPLVYPMVPFYSNQEYTSRLAHSTHLSLGGEKQLLYNGASHNLGTLADHTGNWMFLFGDASCSQRNVPNVTGKFWVLWRSLRCHQNNLVIRTQIRRTPGIPFVHCTPSILFVHCTPGIGYHSSIALPV